MESGGTNYGSPEILNHNRQPTIRLLRGSGAQVTPIVSNGRIIEVSANAFSNLKESITKLPKHETDIFLKEQLMSFINSLKSVKYIHYISTASVDKML